ncbi:MAG: DUF1292 domain-containing protein [Eubacteriales bacterium]
MEEKDNTIVLLDEEGNEIEFELVITIEKEGKEYALLKNVEDDSEDMYAFFIDEDDEGDVLIPIEDDEEIQEIQDVYDELINQE